MTTQIKQAYEAALAAKLQSKDVTDFVTLVVGDIKSKLNAGQLSDFGNYDIPQGCPESDINFWQKVFDGTDLQPIIAIAGKINFTII